MQKKTVEDVEVSGKRAFLRVDFNVPVDKDGRITDDSRVRACLPTIKSLMERRAWPIVCSHLGRPDGRVVESLGWRPWPIGCRSFLVSRSSRLGNPWGLKWKLPWQE